MNQHPRWNRRLICVFLFALGLGCHSPTETDRDNRRLLDAILTAIAMKNEKWLEDDAKLAEQRHSDGQLTNWEHARLVAIIEKGRSGDWQSAEQLGYTFRKAHPFVKEGR